MTRRPTTPKKPATARAPFQFDARWAAALYALLVALLFHDVALEGMTFVSPDTTAPAGFVRVGEQTLYGEKTYPLWNPFVFLGMPSYASGAYNPLIYPPDWPLALLARVVPLPDMIWLLLYYFLGALFTYLLAREWGARPEGALLAGAAYVFAPNLVAVGSHGHGSQLVNSAYVPLLLWLAARWMRRGGVHHLGWLALAGGFQMLRGHVQIAFYTWLAIALWLVVDLVASLLRRGDRPPRVVVTRALAVGGAMVLAFGLAAVYNLPLRDYAKYSIRGGGPDGGVGMDYATAWSLGPWELPTIVVPGYAGFANPTYWGGMPFTDYPNAYVGMVAVVAALPALLTRGAPQAFALVLALFSLGIAFGRHFPLYGFLYDHLPLFNKFRIPVMVIVLFQLGVALALSWGVSRVLDDGEARRAAKSPAKPAGDLGGRLLIGVAAALALALLMSMMGQDALRAGYMETALRHGRAANPGYSPEAAAVAYQGFVGDLARVCMLGLLAVGALLLARRGSLPPLVLSLVLLVLLLVEIWPVSARVMAPVIGAPSQNQIERERDDLVQRLEGAGPPGSYRILPLNGQEFQSNRYAGFGIASVGGYHAAKPRLIQDLISSGRLDNLTWMRLLNVRYVLVDAILDTPGLREVHRGPRMIIYENVAALPRATIVGSYRVAPDSVIIDSIGRGGDPARTTWLTRDPGLTLGPVEGATAQITKYSLNEVIVDVDTQAPTLLRLADLWYPDWVARVDGRAVEILRADYLLRAVPVPAGRHQVVFRFESPAMRIGLLASLASLAAAIALIAWGMLQARRRPAAAREPIGAAGAA